MGMITKTDLAGLALLGEVGLLAAGFYFVDRAETPRYATSYVKMDGRKISGYEKANGDWGATYKSASGETIAVKCISDLHSGYKPQALEMNVGSGNIMRSREPREYSIRSVNKGYDSGAVVSAADALCAEVRQALDDYKSVGNTTEVEK